jgi:hypothetical protein
LDLSDSEKDSTTSQPKRKVKRKISDSSESDFEAEIIKPTNAAAGDGDNRDAAADSEDSSDDDDMDDELELSGEEDDVDLGPGFEDEDEQLDSDLADAEEDGLIVDDDAAGRKRRRRKRGSIGSGAGAGRKRKSKSKASNAIGSAPAPPVYRHPAYPFLVRMRDTAPITAPVLPSRPLSFRDELLSYVASTRRGSKRSRKDSDDDDSDDEESGGAPAPRGPNRQRLRRNLWLAEDDDALLATVAADYAALELALQQRHQKVTQQYRAAVGSRAVAEPLPLERPRVRWDNVAQALGVAGCDDTMSVRVATDL